MKHKNIVKGAQRIAAAGDYKRDGVVDVSEL